MLRICVLKSTGKVIEMQRWATEGTLIKNNKQYYPETDLEERLITEQDYKNMMIAQAPAPIDLKVEFSKCVTADEKLNFIAERLGLKGAV